MMRRRGLLGAAALALPAAARAQEAPPPGLAGKPVRIVIGFTPAGRSTSWPARWRRGWARRWASRWWWRTGRAPARRSPPRRWCAPRRTG
ncbi:hypothetical protein ACFQY5_00660 [Paeniroseomonas aquatica]|uniref:hypothetical protein n=1 Tax=Paeniroseomonas aquatica TaxID=373043 RepID=UPI003622BA5D